MLEIYGDDLFIYYSDIDMIRIMSNYNIENKDIYMSLEDFEQLLKKNSAVDKHRTIEEFVLDIRNGKRYFDICIDGDVFGGEKTVKYTVIRGAFAYENDDRSVLVGYIHKESRGVSRRARKVEFDSLTGVLSKGSVTDIVVRTIDVEKRQNISIAIIDVDYFKKVNDTFGHMMGDKILKKIAAIIKSEVGDEGVVGRIGGDEFFAMFYDVYDLEEARGKVRNIKNTVTAVFPENNENKPVVSLSIGCAAYPKDADNYADLFELADFALYKAKEKGRNRYIIYDKEKHGLPEKVNAGAKMATRINNRGDMSSGDIMCTIMDKVYSGNANPYPVERVLDDFIENFEPQRIIVYDEENAEALYAAGSQIPDKEVLAETQGYIAKDVWQKRYSDDIVLINNVFSIESRDKEVYDIMVRLKILSCVRVRFFDKNGRRCILSLESVNHRITWSDERMKYYRLMAKVLSEYVLVTK